MWKTDHSKEIIEKIKNLPKIDEYSSILDLTSGKNNFIIELAKNFISVFCLKDKNSDAFVKNLEYNNVTNVFVFEGTVKNLKISFVHFDIIYFDKANDPYFIKELLRKCKFLILKTNLYTKLDLKNYKIKSLYFTNYKILIISEYFNFMKYSYIYNRDH